MRAAERLLFFDGPLALLTVIVLIEMNWPGTSSEFAGWPLVISLFLIGMPHGAVDLAVNNALADRSKLSSDPNYGRTRRGNMPKATSIFRLQNRLERWVFALFKFPPAKLHHLGRSVVRFSKYIAVLGLSLSLFLVSTEPALLLFLILSAVHFGLADARDLQRWENDSRRSFLCILPAFVRGCFILGIPFLSFPAESTRVLSEIVSLTGQSLTTISSTFIVSFAAVAVVAASVVQCIVLVVRLKRKQFAAPIREIAETAVLVLAFTVLHPLFAIGLYVLVWHSWRHLLRLTDFLPATKPNGSWQALGESIWRLHLASLPLLVPTIVIFGFVACWVDAWAPTELAILTIAFFVVVTLPHHLLIERLHRHDLSDGMASNEFGLADGQGRLPSATGCMARLRLGLCHEQSNTRIRRVGTCRVTGSIRDQTALEGESRKEITQSEKGVGKRGTGSKAARSFYHVKQAPLLTWCLSHFSRRTSRVDAAREKGDRHRAAQISRNSNANRARSQSPFSRPFSV